MAGGLMQLVAYGAQDVYLTGDPKITFFKCVYARHTSFAMEAIKLNMQGSIGNGNIVQVVIGRDGDLISDMWVELAPILSADPVWIAERAFKSIELTIGGQSIDKHYQVWFRLWSEVFQGESKKLSYGKLTSLGNNVADSSAVNTVSLPLLFFFNKNPGLSLPLIALQYHEVRIIFELADDYMNYFSSKNFDIWGNYMFLDTKERKMFATKGHEYLIEQVQYSNYVVSAGLQKPSFRMTFQHPVKELLWCYQNTTRTGSNMWNFCVDTANVYNSIAQTSNVAPHWYGSPIINVINPVAQGTYDAGVNQTNTTQTQFGYSVSITSDGTAFAEGAPNASSGAGSAAVYRYTNGAWGQGSSLVPSGGVTASSNYGSSVSISPDGTWAIVGAPSATNGAVYIFKYINNVWSFWGKDAGPTSLSKYGTSVAVTSGGNVAAGSPGKSTNAGEARTHNINNAAFSAYGGVINGLAANDKFGTSVAFDSTGTIMAVGAPQTTTGTGLTITAAASTTITHNNVGNKLGTLLLTVTGTTPSSPMTVGGQPLTAGQIFYLVGLSATTSALYSTAATGANSLADGPAYTVVFNNGVNGLTTTAYGIGYVKVYRLVVNTWTADTTDSPALPLMGTQQGQFGTSVSLNAAGNILAVGAQGSSGVAGYVKVFTYNGSAWTLTTPAITAPTAPDSFGTSVSLNPAGTSLAIGSPSGGYVRVYQSTSVGVFPAYASNTYGYSDSTGSSNFGQSVAISQRLVIGAPAQSGTATPVNYLNIYTPVSYPAKTWIEEGGETSATTAGPLSSLNISLNGQSRFFPQSGKYFNQYQPWEYHSGSPYPGIYSYSFGLKPELNQPSGTCNFSRIDNSQINTILKSTMYTPCNLNMFAVNYNILRITAGMAGIAFSN